MFIITADRVTTSTGWWERLSVDEERVVLLSEPDGQEPQTLVLATLVNTEQAVVPVEGDHEPHELREEEAVRRGQVRGGPDAAPVGNGRLMTE